MEDLEFATEVDDLTKGIVALMRDLNSRFALWIRHEGEISPADYDLVMSLADWYQSQGRHISEARRAAKRLANRATVRNPRRSAIDGWVPSMGQVEAAQAAWNTAEPQATHTGASWVPTFAEALVAAHDAELGEREGRFIKAMENWTNEGGSVGDHE